MRVARRQHEKPQRILGLCPCRDWLHPTILFVTRRKAAAGRARGRECQTRPVHGRGRTAYAHRDVDLSWGRSLATFVLVHGAWHGGWCWRRVAPLLRAAGHEVYTPTLTGLGERAHLVARHVDLDTHIADVRGVLQCEELSNVVLCGHSYGGMVISGVAESAPNALRSLVYLDAFVPADGQCLLDFIPAERLAELRQSVHDRGAGWLVPPPSAAFFKVNEADQA